MIPPLLRWLVKVTLFYCLVLQTQAQEGVLGSCDTVANRIITIGTIQLSGNKVTRDHIIYREIEFTQGEQLNCREFLKKLKQSQENLMNRALFNFVTIDTISHGQVMDVKVGLVERWYFWPIPIFELADRNFNAWLQNADWNRVNYGIDLAHNNFRGRMENLRILIRMGYDQNYGLSYDIPYINRKQNIGIGFTFGLRQNREVAVNTIDDQPVFFKSDDFYPRRQFYSEFRLFFRKGFRDTHRFFLQYSRFIFNDTLLLINPLYSFPNNTDVAFFNLGYMWKHDFRDYRPYPLDGYYIDFEMVKNGLGILDSPVDLIRIRSSFDIYRPLAKRWHFLYNITASYMNYSFNPYFLRSGLNYGKNDLIRGYELYVIDGQRYLLMKGNLKFTLLPKKVSKLPLINTEKFSLIHYALFLNLNLDFGFVDDNFFFEENTLSNRYLLGGGIGLDFVTYYDIVVRLEYSWNQKTQKPGMFIHFVAGI